MNTLNERVNTLNDRRARVLLARLAEPYDDAVQALVAEHGIVDLVGYALRDARTPAGVSLQRLAARAQRALSSDDERISRVLGARLLVPGDAEWPVVVDELPTPPWCLWVIGPARLDEVSARGLALVGARASTAYGDHVAASLSVDLVERGFVIVSGAAFGIDAAAHRATLAVDGTTVAVLAGGVDVAYPRANAELIAQVGRTGALVSETPRWRAGPDEVPVPEPAHRGAVAGDGGGGGRAAFRGPLKRQARA